MKALTLYSNEEIYLRQLLRKLNDCGKINCDFPTFSKLYEEWHKKTFPGRPVDIATAMCREDWFMEFVNFLAKKNI